MRLTNSGDLTRSFGLGQAYSRTKIRLEILTREAASGQRADLATSLSGDTRPLFTIENQLRRIDAYQKNAAESEVRLTFAQEAMSGMQKIMSGLGASLIAAPLLDHDMQAVLSTAESNLSAALGFLNSETAGQFIFSGTRTTHPAVVGMSVLMQQIASCTAGLTSAGDIVAAVSAFFDAPVGANGYLDQSVTGSLAGRSAVPIGTSESVIDNSTSATPAFRDMLKGLTLAVLAKRGAITGNETEQGRLVQAAGQIILDAEGAVTTVRAGVGVQQERLELAKVRNAAERSTLQMARSGIVAADPYETAAALTETQVQLETLYSITARLSRMSLADRL